MNIVIYVCIEYIFLTHWALYFQRDFCCCLVSFSQVKSLAERAVRLVVWSPSLKDNLQDKNASSSSA